MCPVPSESLPAADRAYHWARGAILEGTLAEGEFFSEGSVAEATGLSRTPVREALLRLQTEGFVRLYPKRGAQVVSVSEGDVADVVQARSLVEPWAVARAATTSGRSQLADRLEALVDEQARCLRAGDVAGFQEADRAFHLAAVDAAGNAVLTSFVSSLRDRQVRMGARAAGTVGGRAEAILAEHRAIASSIREGEGRAAARAALEHVAATGRILGVADTGRKPLS